MALFGSSSPFGTSTPSPFGATSNPFGTNQASNPFAAKPFGSTAFAGNTGSSLFGGTSTGVFGAPQTSPLGSSSPAFGASSTPAFGSTSSAFGSGTSVFGQKPATTFGGFGSTTTQSNPFGGAFGQSQPAFGSQPFGSTTPAFGSSTPAFGSTSSPFFGAASTPAFGASSTPAFGASSTPAFGASSTPAFGASTTPAFGSSSLFGGSSFGQSTPAFGASSSPAFGSTPVFGSGSSASPFSTPSTPAFGNAAPPSTPGFGSTTFGAAPFGSQRGGSRVASFSVTTDADAGVSGQAGKLMSICAMTPYKSKSPEELRWEDYQAGDKGGPNPAGQAVTSGIFGQPSTSSPFGGASPTTTLAFGQSSTPNLFSGSSSSGIFGAKTTSSPPAFSSTPAFGSTTPSPFGTPSSTAAFGTGSAPSFGMGSSTPLFNTSSSPNLFSSPTGAFGSSSPAFGASNPFAASSTSFAPSSPFGATQTSGSLFSTPAQPFTSASPFGATTPAFGSGTASTFGASSSPFGASTPAFGSGSASSFGTNLFGSLSPSLFQASKPAGFAQSTASAFGSFQPAFPAQNTGAIGFSGLGQSQPVASSSPFGIASAPGFATGQPQAVAAPVPVANPFGTLPAIPQMSIGRSAGTGSSVQYGISSLPVSDKPTQLRLTTLLTPCHVTQRSKIRMPARRYHPSKDKPKVSFFSDGEEASDTPKADALFVPRENPRALFIQHPEKHTTTIPTNSDDVATPVKQDGHVQNWSSPDVGRGIGFSSPASVMNTGGTSPSKTVSKMNGQVPEQNHRGNGYISITGHRAGEAAIAYEHGPDIEALMPKLRHPDYYTEPRLPELAAKERAEPGYCRRVKDFVVGRQGYGFVKFLGETDVRGIDLESIVQFNKCEVLVYMDESKKPAVGLGLNKPAEITLLNVKCTDKKTGQHITEGPEVEKFEKRLKRKTEEQGAVFIYYSAIKGQWKFRVAHFSRYFFYDSDSEICFPELLSGGMKQS